MSLMDRIRGLMPATRAGVDTKLDGLQTSLTRRLNEGFEGSTQREQELTTGIESLGDRVLENYSQLLRRTEASGSELDTLRKSLSEYQERLMGLEQARQRSDIVSGVVIPPREALSANDVRGLAVPIADDSYRRIRDYFLLKMAQSGYQDEKPDILILDRDSSITLMLRALDQHGVTPTSYSYDRSSYKIRTDIENFPPFKFNDPSKHKNNKKILQSIGSLSGTSGSMGADSLALEVIDNDPPGGSNHHYLPNGWVLSLTEDLPQMLKAYMAGYALRCFEKKDYDKALKAQKIHGLENDPVLLESIAERMPHDPNLATRFLSYFGREQK